MSALLVPDETFHVMVSAALAYSNTEHPFRWQFGTSVTRELSPENATATGSMLRAENVRSINQRWSLAVDPDDRSYEFTAPASKPDPLAVLRTIEFYEHQSCERKEWETSEAASFCNELRKLMIHSLPGYSDLPWGANAKNPAVIPDSLPPFGALFSLTPAKGNDGDYEIEFNTRGGSNSLGYLQRRDDGRYDVRLHHQSIGTADNPWVGLYAVLRQWTTSKDFPKYVAGFQPHDMLPLAELVVYRDSDGPTNLSWFRLGSESSADTFDITVTHVDPGATGPDDPEWRQAMEEKADNASPLAAEHIRSLIED